jgi:hypothetical protein
VERRFARCITLLCTTLLCTTLRTTLRRFARCRYLHSGWTLEAVERLLPRLCLNSSAFHNVHHEQVTAPFGEAASRSLPILQARADPLTPTASRSRRTLERSRRLATTCAAPRPSTSTAWPQATAGTSSAAREGLPLRVTKHGRLAHEPWPCVPLHIRHAPLSQSIRSLDSIGGSQRAD